MSKYITRRQANSFKGYKPGTLDEKTRSVEVVGATETPSKVWDHERWEIVEEVLLMKGCEIPKQIPLTIEHYNRADCVIGSLREIRVEGSELVGRVYFSEAEDAESYWVKTREGHLDRFSIVYPCNGRESVYIGENETSTVDGKEYSGPILITKRWTPKALGLVIFPADENAKARSDNQINIEDDMDPKIKQLLIKRGLPEDATDEEAMAFLEKLQMRTEPKPKPEPKKTEKDPVDLDLERSQAAKEERDRVLEINAMCKRFEFDDMADELVKGDVSLDTARQRVLEKLTERNKGQKTPGYRAPAMNLEDEVDKFRAAASDSLLIRSGIGVEKPAVGAHDLTGYSLKELARHSLRILNKPTGGNPLEMVGRALTASDLPILLSNVAHKALFAGWESANETWRIWCQIGQVSDFKVYTSARRSEADDLDKITDHNKYKYGELTEAQEVYQIATYGKMFAVTRKTIIDDDLDSLTDIPKAHGASAARKIGDVVYSVLISNAVMGDGIELFHGNHGNLLTPGPVNEITLSDADTKMGMQKDLKKKRSLNIVPTFFLAPRSMKGATEIFFKSTNFVNDNSAATRTNIYADHFTRVYETRLDDHSKTAWYMAAMGKTVKVFFLNGVQEPYLEQRQGWSVDGTEFKVRIDVGAKAMDWKGLVMNPGVPAPARKK